MPDNGWTSFDTSTDNDPSPKSVAHPPLTQRLSTKSVGLEPETKGLASHTPGPWETTYMSAYPCMPFTIFDSKTRKCIASIDSRNDDFETKANARLITQAPALLEENKALKALNAELIEALESVNGYLDEVTCVQTVRDYLGARLWPALNAVEVARDLSDRLDPDSPYNQGD